MIFFKSDRNFAHWLKHYADGRPIIDVGCGEGRLLETLARVRCRKSLGVDPYASPETIARLMRRGIHVVPMFAEDFSLIRRPGHLIVIARPCHDGFAGRVMRLATEADNEVLYISLPQNVGVDVPEGLEVVEIETPPCPEEHVYRVGRRVPITAARGHVVDTEH